VGGAEQYHLPQLELVAAGPQEPVNLPFLALVVVVALELVLVQMEAQWLAQAHGEYPASLPVLTAAQQLDLVAAACWALVPALLAQLAALVAMAAAAAALVL